ncbi:hypothetical protein HCI96_05605 [Listeria seeligeri]|uniref:YveK family protein n=1 Tax=Listeria seeligeri TaxID=1640 RepID=UPI001627AF1E|nr:Wzz/FepE/Etk N-terminal domain-containing protein [Listeria seeligeri]MBC1826617.1 hypothetical protein [Listeria seeligeri]MBC1870021.1 hypothetical protein [Listeria seeligeri]
MTKFSLNDFWKVIKRYLLLLLIIPLLTTSLVYLVEKVVIPQEYTASTQLLITAQKAEEGQSFDDLRSSIQLIGTFSTTIQSEKVKQEVAKELGIEQVNEDIQVVTDQNSLYFNVDVTGTNQKNAIAVANTLGEVITADFPELFSGMSVHVMEKAKQATPEPIKFQLILGFVFGLMMSIVFAFSMLLFSSVITKDTQLRDIGLTVLGDTPFKKMRK